jgi:hypothetical protein
MAGVDQAMGQLRKRQFGLAVARGLGKRSWIMILEGLLSGSNCVAIDRVKRIIQQF